MMDSPTFQPMTLTKQEIKLVQQSWRLLRLVDPQLVADLFYSKLFLDHPEARALFPKDMVEQHQKLIHMINVVVARLGQLGQIQQEIKEMGKRHVGYGTLPHHYGWVGESLLWTLERGLGADWTPQVAQAWTHCYEILAELMLED